MKAFFVIVFVLLVVLTCSAQEEERGVNLVREGVNRQINLIEDSPKAPGDSVNLSVGMKNQRLAFVTDNRIEEQATINRENNNNIVNGPKSGKTEYEKGAGKPVLLPVLNRAMNLSLVVETVALLIFCVLGVVYKLND